jgi:hypothetical protein
MMYGLSAPDERADHFIKAEQLALGNVRSNPRFNERFAIRLVGLFFDVILFSQHAMGFFKASVATIRRIIELPADLFLEIWGDFIA